MISADDIHRIEKLRSGLKRISGVFFFTVAYLAYLSRTTILSRPPGPVPLEEAARHPLLLTLLPLGIFSAVLTFVLKKFLAPKQLGPGETENLARMRIFARNHVLVLTISESVAIYGFVLGSVVHNFEITVPFYGLTYLLFVLHWPRDGR